MNLASGSGQAAARRRAGRTPMSYTTDLASFGGACCFWMRFESGIVVQSCFRPVEVTGRMEGFEVSRRSFLYGGMALAGGLVSTTAAGALTATALTAGQV